MKNWKRLLALLLAGAMALSLCACGFGTATGGDASEKNTSSEGSSGGFLDFFKGLFGSNADSPDDAPSADGSADPSANPSDSPEIVADLSQGVLEYSAGLSQGDTLLTVNGEELPADTVLYWLNYSCYYFMSGYGIYGLSMSDYENVLLDDAVTLSVSQALMRQKASELGCLPTDAQRQEARDQMAEGQATAELFRTSFGLSEESMEQLFLSSAYYANVLDAVAHEPSAEELDQYLADEGVFSVKHILIKTTDDSNQPLEEAVIAEKKSLADDLLAQLNAAEDMPAKFDELMHEYSEDGGLATNPDGYTFDGSAGLVGGFREAALELEIGGLSGIVETDYGYHIMLRLPVPEDEVELYREDYRADILQGLMNQWVDESEVVRADALTALNVTDFYTKMTAYQQALSAQDGGNG